jgi:hypothetical protein
MATTSPAASPPWEGDKGRDRLLAYSGLYFSLPVLTRSLPDYTRRRADKVIFIICATPHRPPRYR